MESILDRSNSYLRIFTSKVEIDMNLPKWKLIQNEKDKNTNSSEKLKFKFNSEADIMLVNNNISIGEFNEMNSKDFNIYIGKNISNYFKDNFKFSENYFNSIVDEEIILNNTSEEKTSKIQKISKFFRKILNKNNKKVSEEVFEFDVFKFFDNVKGLLKESPKKYIKRIEPYMIALKQAQDMGQIALVDKLSENIFINKYESILYASNFYMKITEQQLVDFVKKSEKGIQLCYIKNFIRPIPEEVIKLKQAADKLLVFDNYCVLFYDKDTKSFSATEAEKEAERKKKADPILFGMIHGSKNLYYVADWIDKYCDLTLEEFLKVSGLTEKEISITEKIKL